MSINSLELNGYLNDVEDSFTQNGKHMVKGSIKFTVGVDAEKNWQHEYLPFVAYGEIADAIIDFDTTKIYKLRGKFSIRPYTNKAGDKAKYYSMIVFEASLDVPPTSQAAPTKVHAPKPSGKPIAFR
jgi:hypothetical protein